MAMVAGKWSISALNVELGVSRRRIGQALEGVEPVEISGRTRYYRMRDAVLAIFSPGSKGDEKKLDITHETARLRKAQADKAELETAQTRGELIPADLVAGSWAEFAGNCRAKLIGLGATAAPRVAGLEVPEIQEILQELVNEALGEIAAYGDDIEGNDKKDSAGQAARTAKKKKPASKKTPTRKVQKSRKKAPGKKPGTTR